MRILFIADIYARPGRRAAAELIPRLIQDHDVQFCIANGENAAGGFGMTDNIRRKLHAYGVDVITSGNHIWNRPDFVRRLDSLDRVLRPLNYPGAAPGCGSTVAEARDGRSVAVVNLQGRTFMPSLDCPFHRGRAEVERLKRRTPTVIVDFHAEATAEKIALGFHLDGIASAVIGTHTHVQTADERILVAPPFTHVFGLSCGMLGLCHGATNVLMSLFSPELYADRLIRGRPTVVFSAPAHVAATIKAGLLDNADLSSIRDVIVAGSVCPPEVAAALERRLPNGRTGQLFGMTETILIMQTPLDAPPEVRHTSTGRKTAGIEVRIANPEDDTDLPAGAEGELQLAGYSVFPGYLNNPEANATAFADDGFFRTGDLATVDADGNVVITGRVKDVINRGGIKINPTDVENLLQAHPAIVLAAVVPMPDDVLGERMCLFVTLAPGAGLTFEEMTGYLEANGVAKMRWPERLEIVDEMPMTPTRKIQKGELAKLVA